MLLGGCCANARQRGALAAAARKREKRAELGERLLDRLEAQLLA